ncbi:hypothetical protein ACX0G9_13030 [Flavitalea flava]
MPPPNAADFKMQRLVIHFRTSAQGPSMRSVELRNGSNTEFTLPTLLRGDYTTRTTDKPDASANAWSWPLPVRVGSTSVLRLGITFPGGIDSKINPGEFIITSVEVYFAPKSKN